MRPHRYPADAPAEVLAWACQACGHVVREFGPHDQTECPVDWRNATSHHPRNDETTEEQP